MLRLTWQRRRRHITNPVRYPIFVFGLTIRLVSFPITTFIPQQYFNGAYNEYLIATARASSMRRINSLSFFVQPSNADVASLNGG